MTNSNHLRNPVTKSLNDLCQDELSVIGPTLVPGMIYGA